MTQSAIQLIDAATGARFPAAPDAAVLASSESAPWPGLIAERQQLGAAELPAHHVVHHRLLINLGGPIALEWRQGAQWRRDIYSRGSFTLMTDGAFHSPRWHTPLDVLAIAIEPQFADALLAHAPVQFREARGVYDQTIYELALQFTRALAAPTQRDPLFIAGLGTAFTFHLLEHYSDSRAYLGRLRGRLQGRALKLVVEYMHDQLAQPLALEQLAALVHLSPFHFARQFRATLGCAPYQFLLRLRVEQAQRLIRAGVGLGEVAAATGFYDQSHFAHAFKRLIGVTPRAFLRQR